MANRLSGSDKSLDACIEDLFGLRNLEVVLDISGSPGPRVKAGNLVFQILDPDSICVVPSLGVENEQPEIWMEMWKLSRERIVPAFGVVGRSRSRILVMVPHPDEVVSKPPLGEVLDEIGESLVLPWVVQNWNTPAQLPANWSHQPFWKYGGSL